MDTGDNAWQMTAATFVALMSVPGLAVLFGGLVQKKWVVNTMLMTFAGFASVLIVWVLWAYQMGFGTPAFHSANWTASSCGICNFFHNFVGKPGTSLSSAGLESRASIPLVDAGMPAFRLPQASVVYFQFVFAAITPLLFLGSVLSRIKFKVWIIFVPLWTSLAYSVNCLPSVGRRLLGAAGCRRLLGWLRHPSGRRRQRFCGRGHGRAPPQDGTGKRPCRTTCPW